MIKEIELNKGVKVIAGDNIVNRCSYVTFVFVGGSSKQKYLEQAHLVEHIISIFKYKINGEIKQNSLLGSSKADARTQNDNMSFSFAVTNLSDLVEKLQILSYSINDVIITKEDLEKEKQTIIDELIYADFSTEYIEKVKNDFKKLTIENIREYIAKNLTSDNLIIYTLSPANANELTNCLNNFVDSLKQTNHKNKITKKPGIWAKDKGEHQHSEIYLTYKLNKPIKTEKEQCLFDLFWLYVQNFRLGIKKPLRHEKRLVYRADVNTSSADRSDLVAKIYCKDDNTDVVIEEALAYFEDLFNNGVTNENFEFIKKNYQDFLFSRPMHVPQRMVVKISEEYLKNKNFHIDEEMQQNLLDSENETVKKYNKQKTDEMINFLSTISLEEFNEFIKSHLLGSNCDIKIENNQVKNV